MAADAPPLRSALRKETDIDAGCRDGPVSNFIVRTVGL